jgi:uncharacterized membrane protein
MAGQFGGIMLFLMLKGFFSGIAYFVAYIVIGWFLYGKKQLRG